jgi:asparagine synthase (glutamine-hydrolysing)
MYTPEFSRRVGSRDSGSFLYELFRRGEALDPLARLGYVDLASFLGGNCLEYADRMSMANSLELRCPFADHRIQEFGLSLPFAWKYRRGKTKWILRQAMKGVLPQSVLKGRKIGFNPPVPEWVNHELRPLISDLLSCASVERRGLFRPEKIKALVEDHREQKRDNGIKIWGLLMLELWFRMYIDRSWTSGADHPQLDSRELADWANARPGTA